MIRASFPSGICIVATARRPETVTTFGSLAAQIVTRQWLPLNEVKQ